MCKIMGKAVAGVVHEVYKDHLIMEVVRYGNGVSDFQVYPDSGNEQGWIEASTTLEKIKEWIDEVVEETSKQI